MPMVIYISTKPMMALDMATQPMVATMSMSHGVDAHNLREHGRAVIGHLVRGYG